MTRNCRKALGVGLIGALVVVLVSGFLAGTSRDPYLVMLGYAFGLSAAYATDRLNRSARKSVPTADKASMLTLKEPKASPEVWTVPASDQGTRRAPLPEGLEDSRAHGASA